MCCSQKRRQAQMLQSILSQPAQTKSLVRTVSSRIEVAPPPYKEEDSVSLVPVDALALGESDLQGMQVTNYSHSTAVEKTADVVLARAGLRVRSWNQPFNASYRVDMSFLSRGSDVILRSRNNAINSTLYLEGSGGEADITVRTKNAPVCLAVAAGQMSPQIECSTKNAPISLQLHQGFHGIIELRTKQADIVLAPSLAQRAVRVRNSSCCKEKRWATYQIGGPGGRDSAWVKTKFGRIDVGLLSE